RFKFGDRLFKFEKVRFHGRRFYQASRTEYRFETDKLCRRTRANSTTDESWHRCVRRDLRKEDQIHAVQSKKALVFWTRAFLNGDSGADLLSHGQSAISSARRCFTVLFGMGRGGSTLLWAPE